MLTKRQKQVLDFIKGYQKNRGYAPSLKEICKKFKLASVSTAHFHVSKLRDAGYLEKEGNKPRAIDATKREEIIKIPVVGIIAAGQPIEAIEIPDATIAISKKEIIPTEKLPVLEKSSLRLNFLRVFLRLCKEIKVLDNRKYILLEEEVDEIGRMLGGWIKSTKDR